MQVAIMHNQQPKSIDEYESFVSAKRRNEVATGHQPGPLNEHLFDFQHAVVSWAVRRCYRFGQKRSVQVHIFTAENEGQILANIKRKEQQGLFNEIAA